jgi:hypothetical protein
VTLPTFVIGGAPKSGTTALWGMLREHPDVFMTAFKEPHFFTREVSEPAPGVRIVGRPRPDSYARGMDWYESLFEGGEGRAARGEASTHYLCARDAPELMERHVPGLRIIFVLRQPVDRAYSHYWHYRKNGHRLPPFEAILDDDPQLRYLDYVSRYAEHLQRYREAFGPERVYVATFDDFRADPARTYREVCRFIGVDDSFHAEYHREYNPHGKPASSLVHGLLRRTKRMRWTFLPAGLRHRARDVRGRLDLLNLRRTAYPELAPDVWRRMTELFEPDIRYVEELLHPLPAWREQRVPHRPAAEGVAAGG